MTRKQEQDKRRSEFLKKLIAFIESEGDEAIQIKKNEVAFPIVFDNGDEAFMKMEVSSIFSRFMCVKRKTGRKSK